DEDLLAPETHFGSFQIGGKRLLSFAAIPIALRQVEGVARAHERVLLRRQRPFQDFGVSPVFLRVAAARALDAGTNMETLNSARRDAAGRVFEKLVDDAAVVELLAVATDL